MDYSRSKWQIRQDLLPKPLFWIPEKGMSQAPYKMTITMKLEDAAGTAMSDTSQVYSNLDYEHVVAIQEALLSAAIGMGKAKAAEKAAKGKQ